MLYTLVYLSQIYGKQIINTLSFISAILSYLDIHRQCQANTFCSWRSRAHNRTDCARSRSTRWRRAGPSDHCRSGNWHPPNPAPAPRPCAPACGPRARPHRTWCWTDRRRSCRRSWCAARLWRWGAAAWSCGARARCRRSLCGRRSCRRAWSWTPVLKYRVNQINQIYNNIT